MSRKVLERPQGRGVVFAENGDRLAEASYDFIATVEMLEGEEGHRSVTGKLAWRKAYLDQALTFTLRLADGRCLDFILPHVDHAVDDKGEKFTAQVQATGYFYDCAPTLSPNG